MTGGLERRKERLAILLTKLAPVPAEWLEQAKARLRGDPELLPCTTWKDLINDWLAALRWRQDIDDAFSVMLAVILSTEQEGDQLFLQLIADAGSAKTRLCDAVLTSPRCFPLEHLTGFHSGWKDAEGNDYSLLARVNKKCLITPEGDVLMSSPRFVEIMSQQRRIFDGTSGASYKNRKEDMRYVGLRTPWIIAGTPALLNMNQSRLGDRFLRVFIGQPDEDEKRSILRRVGYSAWDSAARTVNGDPSSIMEGRLLTAYKKTGGYVEWLRHNAGELLSAVVLSDRELGEVEDRCATLAEFVAVLRARPDMSKEERHDSKELPTRLHHQFMRLTRCLCAVLNRPKPDADVLRRVRKVALDTARGRTLSIVKKLWAEEAGFGCEAMATWIGETEERTRGLLLFLRRNALRAVESFKDAPEGMAPTLRWRLTPRLRQLCDRVLGEKEDPR